VDQFGLVTDQEELSAYIIDADLFGPGMDQVGLSRVQIIDADLSGLVTDQRKGLAHTSLTWTSSD